MADHLELGKRGESLAADFLNAKGYHVLDRNYRFERAEIDIVALRLDPAEVVFVEVKTRRSTNAEYPEEAVDKAKKKRIFRVADSYLYERQLLNVPVRFDIIAIDWSNAEHPLIHHIEDAFNMFDPWEPDAPDTV